jgi:hypothetical protein
VPRKGWRGLFVRAAGKTSTGGEGLEAPEANAGRVQVPVMSRVNLRSLQATCRRPSPRDSLSDLGVLFMAYLRIARFAFTRKFRRYILLPLAFFFSFFNANLRVPLPNVILLLYFASYFFRLHFF